MLFYKKPGQKKLTKAQLSIFIGFLLVIASAIFLYIQPFERKRQERDARFVVQATTIAKAIDNYFTSKGKVPWADDTGLTSPAPALKWTPIENPVIGICGDINCTKPGDLITEHKLNYDYFIQLQNTLKEEQKQQDKIYVGKGHGTQTPIYVCFVPIAREAKKALGSLYNLDLGSTLLYSQKPKVCDDTVSWEDGDYCYVCVNR